MSDPDPEFRKELHATLAARKDLGPAYESELIDSFLERTARQLDARVESRVRRELADGMADGPPDRHASGRFRAGHHDNRNRRFGLAGISLVLAIPLSAVGVVNAHLPGLLITWAGIVGVNVAHSLDSSRAARRERRGGGRADGWD